MDLVSDLLIVTDIRRVIDLPLSENNRHTMLDLLDYRRQVSEMYRTVREQGAGAADPCVDFRRRKDGLFRTHPQTPLDEAQRRTFSGLHYFPYDPDYCVIVAIDTKVDALSIEMDLGEDGICLLETIGSVSFDLPSGSGALQVYWIKGYGGGLFLPFRDATNGTTTYGGGRYLFDTIKGADLGGSGAYLVLDFNYAFHPSCAYNPRWVCPLAPPASMLSFPVPAGERLA